MQKLLKAILLKFRNRKKDIVVNIDVVTVGDRSRREVAKIAEMSIDLIERTENYQLN